MNSSFASTRHVFHIEQIEKHSEPTQSVSVEQLPSVRLQRRYRFCEDVTLRYRNVQSAQLLSFGNVNFKTLSTKLINPDSPDLGWIGIPVAVSRVASRPSMILRRSVSPTIGFERMIQKLHTRQSCSTARAEAAVDSPQGSFRGRLITSVDELESLKTAWERLLNVSVHRNLFFDPDFLIPAFKHLADETVSVLVIDAPSKVDPSGPRVICGLLPLKEKRIYGLPFRGQESWLHDQCFDSTPLLRCDCARDVLNFMLDFLTQTQQTALLGLDVVSNEGEFANILTEVLNSRRSTPFYRDSFVRASFQPELDFETYLQLNISKRMKQNFRRLGRRLEERGEVSISCSRDQESNQDYIEQFLELEASGWKAESGTALRCRESTRDFFCEMVTRSLANKKLKFLSVNFNGKPISMLCDLYSDNFGYSYKTAIADDMKEFSPGLMAEIHNIQNMHENDVQFSDSCTLPNNELINRIWKGRTRFQSLVVPLRGRLSHWATATMPMMQQLSRTFSRH